MEDRLETVEEKQRVEAMVAAVLSGDAHAQANAAAGLTPGEERYVRAGAGIIAGLFTALSTRSPLSAAGLWQEHVKRMTASREGR